MAIMIFSSMNLGILSSIMSFLIELFMNVVFFIVNVLYAVFATIFYMIGSIFGYFADFFQAVFKALAGIGQVGYDKPSNAYLNMDSDPILQLITHRVVINLFISLFVVAIGLMIVSTIIQMIRQEYTTEGAKNSKGEILGKAVKAFSNMIVVPVAVVIGILLSNTILRLLDKATSGSSQSIGATVFISAAYDANFMRSASHGSTNLIDMSDSWFNVDLGKVMYGDTFVSSAYTEEDQPVSDDWMDSQYSNGGTIGYAGITCADLADQIDYAFKDFSDIEDSRLTNTALIPYFDYKEMDLVGKYYNMGKINYIIYIAGEVMCAWIMLNVTLGMIMRMYNAALYFIILPPILAISPIKDAYGSWRQKFVGNVLGAYGPIVGINLFFAVFPVVQEIEVFQPGYGTSSMYNSLLQMLFAIVGLLMVKKFVGSVAGMIGADDALAAGEGISKQVAGGVAKVGMAAMGAGAIAGKALKIGARGARSIGDSIASSRKKDENQEVSQASDLVDKRNKLNEANQGLADLEIAKKKKHITKADYEKEKARLTKQKDDNAYDEKAYKDLEDKGLISTVADENGKFSLSGTAQKRKDKLDKLVDQGRYVKEADGSYKSSLQKAWDESDKETDAAGDSISRFMSNTWTGVKSLKTKEGWKNLGRSIGRGAGAVWDKFGDMASAPSGSLSKSLNSGLDASMGNLFKAMGIDLGKAKSKAASGKGGLLSKAVSGIANGVSNFGETDKVAGYGARYNEAHSAVANRADTLVERLLQDILNTLKDSNSTDKEKKAARELGKVLSGNNFSLAEKFDKANLSKDEFNLSDMATIKANAVNMSAAQMASGKGTQDSNLLRAVEKATFKTEVGSGVVNEFAQKVKQASLEAADKIAAKSKSDTDKTVSAINKMREDLVDAIKNSNKNNTNK